MYRCFPSRNSPVAGTISWYKGPGMFAYTDKAGALHAHLYNSDAG